METLALLLALSEFFLVYDESCAAAGASDQEPNLGFFIDIHIQIQLHIYYDDIRTPQMRPETLDLVWTYI